MRVTYTVDKEDVLKEVRRLTHYVGSRKVGGDDSTFERISTTESDHEMLDQFWNAACSAATDQLKHFAMSVNNDKDGNESYEVVMEMPSQYDTTLNESIEDSLTNFFINLIASKWCKIADQEDEAKYAADALGYMADVDKKMYYRKRPTRGQ